MEAYDDLRWTPLLLAGLLGLLALGTLAHTLVIATRNRRHDFAVLKTFGFTSGQVSATVAWHATTVILIALVVALPVGVVLGRLGWRLFADNLGVVASPVVPIAIVLALVPVTVFVTNALAFAPGRIAARTPAAAVLRSE